MKAVFKTLGIIVFGLLAVPFLVSFVIFDVGNCDEDSDAVVLAKSLSEARLANLVVDVGAYFEAHPNAIFDLEELPESVMALNPGHFTLHGGNEMWIYLHACTPDSKVILFVDAEENKIIVSWGDWASPKSGSKVLWSGT